MNKSQIRSILTSEYGIVPNILEKSAWGYNTVAYYAQEGTDKFVVKVTNNVGQALSRCQKDVRMSALLSGVLPTPVYLQNKRHDYILAMPQAIVRVAKYIDGTAPFRMTLPIYLDMLIHLRKLHEFSLGSNSSLADDLRLAVVEGGRVLLHGDLTPSNVIVFQDKVVGVLDFEDSLIGPIEYDLAKSAVFSWFRTENIAFREVFDFTLASYPADLDKEKLLSYCVAHSQNHLDQILAHKHLYKDKGFWRDDFEFSAKAAEEIKSLRL